MRDDDEEAERRRLQQPRRGQPSPVGDALEDERGHAADEQQDGEEERDARQDRAAREQRVPVEPDAADDEDDDGQPQERGSVLHGAEGGEPEDQGDENGRDRVPHQVGEAGNDLQDQGHAGDLNDQGEHVDE